MQVSKYMCIFLTAAMLFSSTVFSQGKIPEINDSTRIHVYLAERGDTLRIMCDSVFVLNKRTFKIFQNSYKQARNSDAAAKALVDDYESFISLQDSMLKAKENYYQQLKSNFDDLATTTNKFVDKTDLNVSVIQQSVSNAESNVNSIKTHIDSSLEKLKLLQRQKLKWMIGGFTVGVGITSLIFLVK